MKLCLLISLFLLSFSPIALGSLYGSGSAVVDLNIKNFRDTVLLSDSVWMVEFYAPWCGHCKNLVPEWEKAAKAQKGIVNLGAVNCDAQENQPLCGQYEVKGFPTIKLFPGKYLIKANGQVEKKAIDYQGPRTAAPIAKFGLGHLHSYVTSVTDKTAEKFLSSPLKKVILFTDKTTTSPLYKALSCDFKDRLAMGEVRKSETALVEKYKVTAFPTLIVVNGDEHVAYDGKLEHAAITTFLSKHAPAKTTPGGGSAPAPEPEKPKVIKYELKEITKQEEFDAACDGPMCIVAFLDKDPETNKYAEDQLAVLKEAQDKYPKHYQVVYMDGPSHANFMATFDLTSGCPSAMLLSKKKKVYSTFTSSFSAPALISFMDSKLRSSKRIFPINEIPLI